MSIIGVKDYVWTTFRHSALCAGVSHFTNWNDPRAAAITAVIEVALNSVVNSLYSATTGKKVAVNVADSAMFDSVSIKEYCSLSLAPAYVSARLSQLLGNSVKITNHMIVSELCKLGYSTLSLGLLMAHNKRNERVFVM